MAKLFACALTHVRHEGFFLEKWIAYYGAIVGRENLYVVIDGDDWTPAVDLSGIQTEVVLDAPRQRIRNDRWIADQMSARANTLRKRYSYVVRGDCDEYVVVDPACGLDWPEALLELGDDGYIFAIGIDMVQAPGENQAVDRTSPILGQRRFGYVADRYSKPFVISRWNNWSGGGHRLLNRKVKLSNHFRLFHLALADRHLAAERMLARGGLAQHSSHLDHQQTRLTVIDETVSARLFDYDQAISLAQQIFPFEEDGTPAKRPRATNVDGADEKGLLTEIPARFFGLL